MADDPDEPLTELEIAQRRDSAIRRALNMPPQPTKKLVGKFGKGRNRPITVKKPDQSKTDKT